MILLKRIYENIFFCLMFIHKLTVHLKENILYIGQVIVIRMVCDIHLAENEFLNKFYCQIVEDEIYLQLAQARPFSFVFGNQ